MICTSRTASCRRPACSTPAMNSIGSTSVGRIVLSDLAMARTVRPAAGDGVLLRSDTPAAGKRSPAAADRRVARASPGLVSGDTNPRGAGNGTVAAPSRRRLRGRQLGAVLLATLDQGGEDLREQLFQDRK